MIAHTVCNTYIELGVNAYKQGFRDVGDQMLEAALEEAQRLSSKDSPPGVVFDRLAHLFYQQKNFDKAETVYKEALGLYDRMFEADDTQVAKIVLNLAELYFSLAKYDEAVPLYERALTIREKIYGKDSPMLEKCLLKLAFAYCRQDRLSDAALLYSRVRKIRDARTKPLEAVAG